LLKWAAAYTDTRKRGLVLDVSIRKKNKMSSSNIPTGGVLARMKGLIWVAVAIGAFVTLIAVAPIISHNF